MITPKFRLSFHALLAPENNKLSKKDEFYVQALFPKGAVLNALQIAAEEVVVAKWGADNKRWPNPMRSPFRDQAELQRKDDNSAPMFDEAGQPVLYAGAEAGAIFMRFATKNRPGVVDGNVEPILDPVKVYSGCWCIADVKPFAYTKGGNTGVSFGLNHVQIVADGEPLGNTRVKVEAAFKKVESAGKPASALFG